MQSRHLTSCALICVGLLGSLLRAATPATNPATPATTAPQAGVTNRDYAQAMLEFNRRTLSEAYKQVGQKDPKWDDDAIKFLEGMALRFTVAGSASLFDDLPELPKDAQLIEWAESARNKGCNDPIVMYSYAAVINDNGDVAAARPLFLKAADDLMTSHYPPVRALYAAGRQWSLSKG